MRPNLQRHCLHHTLAELASRAQSEVYESSGTIKAVHPSRQGLDIAVRLARLREAATSAAPAQPLGKSNRSASAQKARKDAAAGDAESTEGYSADFASDSAGDAPGAEDAAAAAVSAVAPPQVRQ